MEEKIQSKVYSIGELCTVLDIGRNTAYDLLNSGEIRAFKMGTTWKIPIVSVDQYLNNQCDKYAKSIKEKKEICKIIN